MTRILADLPDEDIKWLDQLAAEQGKSRAAVLREAVAAYKPQSPNDWIEQGFGAWKHRTDIGDAVEWQRRERAANTRPWDFDYPEVRAEFPDLFDEEDDREHERHLAWLAEHGMKLGDGFVAPGMLERSLQKVSGFAFDSNILIDLLRGFPEPKAELERAVQRGRVWISRVVWIEVMSKGDGEALRRTEALLSGFGVDEVDEEIAERAERFGASDPA